MMMMAVLSSPYFIPTLFKQREGGGIMGDDLICIRFRFNSIWNSRNGSRALEQFFQSLYGDNKREMSINFLSPCHKKNYFILYWI